MKLFSKNKHKALCVVIIEGICSIIDRNPETDMRKPVPVKIARDRKESGAIDGSFEVEREKEVTPDVASLPVLDLVLEELPQACEEQEQEVLGNFSNTR